MEKLNRKEKKELIQELELRINHVSEYIGNPLTNIYHDYEVKYKEIISIYSTVLKNQEQFSNSELFRLRIQLENFKNLDEYAIRLFHTRCSMYIDYNMKMKK